MDIFGEVMKPPSFNFNGCREQPGEPLKVFPAEASGGAPKTPVEDAGGGGGRPVLDGSAELMR